MCKGPEVQAWLAHLRKSEAAQVATGRSAADEQKMRSEVTAGQIMLGDIGTKRTETLP